MLIKVFTLGAMLAISPAATASPAPPEYQAGYQECGASTPGVRVTITGLKDRSGRLKLELYPANQTDFLRNDEELLKAGKVFRRIETGIAKQGDVSLCITAPRAGRYAVIVVHKRDGKSKFSISKDGIGVPGTERLGRKRPSVEQADVMVGNGITTVSARMQYLRGLSGFGPATE
jgi:uncharacterized protein (DUF2141 family)